jgi:hypothetical protein
MASYFKWSDNNWFGVIKSKTFTGKVRLIIIDNRIIIIDIKTNI